MTIVDRQGNKLQKNNREGLDAMKINTKSSMKQNMFSKSLIKKDGKDMPYGGSIETKPTERAYNTAGQKQRAKNSIMGLNGEQP